MPFYQLLPNPAPPNPIPRQQFFYSVSMSLIFFFLKIPHISDTTQYLSSSVLSHLAQ